LPGREFRKFSSLRWSSVSRAQFRRCSSSHLKRIGFLTHHSESLFESAIWSTRMVGWLACMRRVRERGAGLAHCVGLYHWVCLGVKKEQEI